MHYGFGTVLGQYTVAELIDLVSAKDVTVSNMIKQYNEVKDVADTDPTFIAAYNDLLTRYLQAHDAAERAVQNAVGAIRPASLILADSEYRGILAALNPRWQEHAWEPGDGSIESIMVRLHELGATGKDNEPIPQPAKGSDADLDAYQTADQVTHVIDQVIPSADKTHLLLYGIGAGLLAAFILPRLLMPYKR